MDPNQPADSGDQSTFEYDPALDFFAWETSSSLLGSDTYYGDSIAPTPAKDADGFPLIEESFSMFWHSDSNYDISTIDPSIIAEGNVTDAGTTTKRPASPSHGLLQPAEPSGRESHSIPSSVSNYSSMPKPEIPSKIGARFTSGPIRILKDWLSQHIHQPYPMTGDLELLQKQTGLSRQQITTWLNNARRRLRNQAARPPTPLLGPMKTCPINISNATEVLPIESMNPLERWEHSPPEHEPANVLAIEKAVSDLSSSPRRRNHSNPMTTRSAESLRSASSASSTKASYSSESSIASSVRSGTSQRSVDAIRKAIKRRRRRIPKTSANSLGLNTLSQASLTFQCTFCTETFRTKHNWQRHEKSLHLSLEQWICSPHGPTVKHHDTIMCVFCGGHNPSQRHLLEHNYDSCQERSLEERTYYRKDHLQQHLKMVHVSHFNRDFMEDWKVECQKTRSRCGFCDLRMETWSDRADHIAQHFKEGKSMADWKGDWGFEPQVMSMVENAVPPYLIHYERNSPWPFTTDQGPPRSPKSAFELLKVELEYFVTKYTNSNNSAPTSEKLQYEACCVIFGAESFSKSTQESWLRDLLMSSEPITKQARLRDLRTAAKSRFSTLKINGKDNIFEDCVLEEQLVNYVEELRLLGTDVGDEELQREASSIVVRTDAPSAKPSKMFCDFLIELISGSTCWLRSFRQRHGLSLMTALSSGLDCTYNTFLNMSDSQPVTMPSQVMPELQKTAGKLFGSNSDTPNVEKWSAMSILGDDNCYRQLARELARYVASVTSLRNPDYHIPSDEELQHQARWIMFEDDDPWNQTPFDNPVWLQEFKREVGLSSADDC